MVRYTDDKGRVLCHRCMDRGQSTIAVVEVPARKPGYVYYMCVEHFRVWYRKQQRARRHEAEQMRLISRRRRVEPQPQQAAARGAAGTPR